MNIYKTIEVPAKEATTKKVFYMTVCDICKSEAKERGYDVGEASIQMREGESLPDCGHGTEINIDLCMECFREKMIPFLESEGVVINETEWDF